MCSDDDTILIFCEPLNSPLTFYDAANRAAAVVAVLRQRGSAIKFLLRQQSGVPVETVKQIMLSVRMEVLKRAVDCYHRQGQPPQLRALLEIGSKQLLLKILR